jgi:hypothetical protein
VGDYIALLLAGVRAVGALCLLVLTIHLIFQSSYTIAVIVLLFTPIWLSAGTELFDRTLRHYQL